MTDSTPEWLTIVSVDFELGDDDLEIIELTEDPPTHLQLDLRDIPSVPPRILDESWDDDIPETLRESGLFLSGEPDTQPGTFLDEQPTAKLSVRELTELTRYSA